MKEGNHLIGMNLINFKGIILIAMFLGICDGLLRV